MSLRKRWKRRQLDAGLLALALVAVLISCLNPRRRSRSGELGKGNRVLSEHTMPVQALAFRSDSTTLISVACFLTSLQGVEVLAWDGTTGQLKAKSFESRNNFRGLVLAPNGRTLVAAGEDRDIWVLDTARPHEWRRLGDQEFPLRVLAISDDGTLLATNDFRCGAWLWQVHGRQPNGYHLFESAKPLLGLAFASNGVLLASSDTDNTIQLWDTVTGKEPGVRARRHTPGLRRLCPHGTALGGDPVPRGAALKLQKQRAWPRKGARSSGWK